jgi:hypothetical protein
LLLLLVPPLLLLGFSPEPLFFFEFEQALSTMMPATPTAAIFARELVRTDVSSSFFAACCKAF